MTNSAKLKGKIAEAGFNLSSLSDALKISRTTLRQKVNGESEFRVSEINKLCEVLSIPQKDIDSYFFNPDVPNKET